MELSAIKTYRINDQVVWQADQPITDLEAIINRVLPPVGIRRGIDTPAYTPAPITPAPIKAPVVGSKKSAAIAIYRSLVSVAGTTKRTIMDVFIAELDMTEAGAQTYYYTARTAVAQS